MLRKHALSIVVCLVVVAVLLAVTRRAEERTAANPSALDVGTSSTRVSQTQAVAQSNASQRSKHTLTDQAESDLPTADEPTESTTEEPITDNGEPCTPELIQQAQDLIQTLDMQGPYEVVVGADGEPSTGRDMNASFEYLSGLDDESLGALAEQGFRDALVVRGEQLIAQSAPELKQQGRDYLYRAGVLGSGYALAGLSISYYGDYLELNGSQDLSATKTAYRNFHNTQNVLKQLVPMPAVQDPDFEAALINESLVPMAELQDSHATSLKAFNDEREREGLPKIGTTSVDSEVIKARTISKKLQSCLANE